MLLTRAPVAGREGRSLPPDALRLACVKPAASVHPEPGSNSPLLFIYIFRYLTVFASPRLHTYYLILGTSPPAYLFVRSWPYLFSFLRIDGKLFFCFPCLCCSDGYIHPCPVASFHCSLLPLKNRNLVSAPAAFSSAKLINPVPLFQILKPSE